jgi:hypothetical protein
MPPITDVLFLLYVIDILLNVGPKMRAAICTGKIAGKSNNTMMLSTGQFSNKFWIYPIIWDFVTLEKIQHFKVPAMAAVCC